MPLFKHQGAAKKPHPFTDEQIQAKVYELRRSRGNWGRSSEDDWKHAIDLLKQEYTWQQIQQRFNRFIRVRYVATFQGYWFFSQAIKVGIPIFGALTIIAAAIGFYVTNQNSQAERLPDTERLMTDRLGNVVKQLESEEIAVRVEAIYALERIAKNSPEDHWLAIEALTAYVRKQSPLLKGRKPKNSKNQPHSLNVSKLPADIQLALTVIGRRDSFKDSEIKSLNLSAINISRANLAEANFLDAILIETDLREANLFKADLFKADLGEANLSEANLREANLSEANLFKANLFKAGLRKADLSQAHLDRAFLSGSDLSEVLLSEAYLNRANFSEANLSGANLSEAYLNRANLNRANLRKANLSEAFLRAANIKGANLTRANLSGANLNGADLTFADLTLTDFYQADLSFTNLKGSLLRGANLSFANLRNSQNVTDHQLQLANLCKTKLPESSLLNPDRNCKKLGVNAP